MDFKIIRYYLCLFLYNALTLICLYVFMFLQRRSLRFPKQSKAAMNTVSSLETNFPVETLPSLSDSAAFLILNIIAKLIIGYRFLKILITSTFSLFLTLRMENPFV